MPLYDFMRISTGETWEELMSISNRDELLKDSDIIQIPAAPRIVSGVVGISMRTDDGFKEVLSKVAEAHPASALYEKHAQKGVKEVKTNQVIEKHFGKK